MKLSILMLCKDSAETIEQSLASAAFGDEIIVLDDHSSDNSRELVKKFTKNIFEAHTNTFAEKRMELFTHATNDWVFYLDSDEVITNKLRQELENLQDQPKTYLVKRRNFFLGTEMYQDQVERLFHKSVLKGWIGNVHESPQVKGEVLTLAHPLLHYTHRSIRTMLHKTNEWSEYEADLRIHANHPPVAWWRLVRIAITELWKQFGDKRLLRFGRAGLFEGYFQMIDKLIVYTKLWERQRIRQ